VHRSRVLAVAGVVVATASLGLPFVTLDALGTIGGIDADAWPVLLFLGPLLLLLILGDRREAPARPIVWIGMGVAAGGLAFAVIKMADARLAVAETPGSLGAGPWVMIAGAVTALVGIALGFSRRL
jgi:hypothetical protein